MAKYDTEVFFDIIKEIRDACHQNSISKGFWDREPWNFGEKLALIHSELSEMFEAWRKGQSISDKDIVIEDPSFEELPGQRSSRRRITAIEEEVADVFIRLMDLCGKLNIDVGRVVVAKMKYNASRSHMHGGRKC